MTWWAAEPLARGGVTVRRRAWLASTPLRLNRVVYVAGAGTSRSVAVMRNGTIEAIITPAVFGVSEFAADDWEIAT